MAAQVPVGDGEPGQRLHQFLFFIGEVGEEGVGQVVDRSLDGVVVLRSCHVLDEGRSTSWIASWITRCSSVSRSITGVSCGSLRARCGNMATSSAPWCCATMLQ